jgi:hypothetical protein
MQKNKLLLTSALVGASMLSAAVVSAEMKVSGYMEYTHVLQSSDATAGVKPGEQQIAQGVETDIIFSNSLDLGNGMKGTVTANITNEATGTYNNGDTAMGLDAAVLDIDTGKGFNIVLASSGFGPADIGEVVPTVLDIGPDTGISSIADANNFDLGNTNVVGVKVGGLSIAYTPNYGGGALGASKSFAGSTVGTQKSAYDVAYSGSFENIGFKAGIHKAEAYLAADQGQESISYGVNYKTGPIAVGAQFTENTAYKSGSGTQTKIEQTNVGLTYSVNDQITLGVVRSEDKTNTASSSTQTTNSVQVGYALGPVGIAVAYTKADNIAYSTGRDGSATTVKIATKF